MNQMSQNNSNFQYLKKRNMEFLKTWKKIFKVTGGLIHTKISKNNNFKVWKHKLSIFKLGLVTICRIQKIIRR